MKRQQSLGRTFLISRREYLERVRTKTFLITTLITPAMMLGFMFLPDFFMSMKTGGAKNIIVVSDDPAVANAFKSEIEKNKEPKYEVTSPPAVIPMKRQQSLGRTFLISRREYFERVRTKTFLITTLITPAMMLGFMFLPDFFMSMKKSGKNIKPSIM